MTIVPKCHGKYSPPPRGRRPRLTEFGQGTFRGIAVRVAFLNHPPPHPSTAAAGVMFMLEDWNAASGFVRTVLGLAGRIIVVDSMQILRTNIKFERGKFLRPIIFLGTIYNSVFFCISESEEIGKRNPPPDPRFYLRNSVANPPSPPLPRHQRCR